MTGELLLVPSWPMPLYWTGDELGLGIGLRASLLLGCTLHVCLVLSGEKRTSYGCWNSDRAGETHLGVQ